MNGRFVEKWSGYRVEDGPPTETGIDFPSKAALVALLRRHPLIHLKGKVRRAFVVGSFARGTARPDSDFDVLLEVDRTPGWSSDDVEAFYRRRLQQCFVTHGLRGQHDEVHPQWRGRRVDVYFTYDADAELRPKIELR